MLIKIRSGTGFATPTGTFEDFNSFQNVSDGVANPVTLQHACIHRQNYFHPPHLQHRQMLATFSMHQITAALQHKITAP